MKALKLNYYLIYVNLIISLTILNGQANSILLNFSINSYELDRFNLPEINASIESGIGYNIGFAYEKPILKKTSFQLGFQFSKRKYDYALGIKNNNFNDNYVSFPLNINFYIFNFLAIQAGMQFDHLVFKQKFIYYKDAPNDQISGYTKYDFGLNTGIRIILNNFELSGSFNKGLRNIYCVKYVDPGTGKVLDDFAKSHMFKFGISYIFK